MAFPILAVNSCCNDPNHTEMDLPVDTFLTPKVIEDADDNIMIGVKLLGCV